MVTTILLRIAAVACVWSCSLVATFAAPAEEATTATQAVSTLTMAELCSGKLNIVDLSWSLNRDSAFWPGDNYKPFELHTIATLEKDGVLSKAFCTPEHLGTHIDAPNHFERNGISVEKIPAEQLFSAGAVIDISARVTMDPDYRLTVANVEQWEQSHGRLPEHAVVFLYTGWSRFWGDTTRYQNRDVMGRLHFPGFSAEAVEFLIHKRQIRGVGLDTMSVDYGLSRDFPVHHILGKAECYGLENVAHLDRLSARGFYVSVAPIKIESGTGGPTRIFAILPAH